MTEEQMKARIYDLERALTNLYTVCMSKWSGDGPLQKAMDEADDLLRH